MKAQLGTSQEKMEGKIQAIQCKFQTQFKEIESEADCGRGTGTGMGVAKPPKFDGTVSWAVFWC
jgi:hypothetical protein